MRVLQFFVGVIAVLSLLMSSLPVHPAEAIVSFENEQHNSLYQVLLKEYRCLKCQNQNLADSNAGLAGDLRREIREQITAGKSKQEIDAYLVARYGEFVLYRPRFNAKTAVLWIAPFVLLLIAVMALVLMARRRSPGLPDAAQNGSDLSGNLADSKLEKARKLLSD